MKRTVTKKPSRRPERSVLLWERLTAVNPWRQLHKTDGADLTAALCELDERLRALEGRKTGA